jgi:hypothetical protein
MSRAVAPGRKLEKVGEEKFGTAKPFTSVGVTSGLNQRNVHQVSALVVDRGVGAVLAEHEAEYVVLGKQVDPGEPAQVVRREEMRDEGVGAGHATLLAAGDRDAVRIETLDGQDERAAGAALERAV